MWEICHNFSSRKNKLSVHIALKSAQFNDLFGQSLLEYKAMNVKLGNHAYVSDLIHVTLWRNDGFLHSFCNFSKSNAFDENFLRTKFILHKIFFRISVLSNRKTLLMFFSLCWENCEKSFIGGHDHFKWKGVSGDKNQYKLFCKKWGFEYFS